MGRMGGRLGGKPEKGPLEMMICYDVCSEVRDW